MPLDDILAQTKLVTVKYGEHELNFEYYRQRLFDAEGQRLTAAVSVAQSSVEIGRLGAEHLARLIAWWDLYEREGVALPITAQALQALPLSLLCDLIRAIAENESAVK